MLAALISIETGDIVVIGTLPFTHELPDGGLSLLEEVGQEVPAHAVTYRVMEYERVDFDRPGVYYTQGEDIETRDGDVITVTRQWTEWTAQEIDAFHASRRDDIADQFDDIDDVTRAAALVIMDELNRSAALTSGILQAVAAASTLATLKSGIALLQPIAQRTPSQIKTAIRAKLGVGAN